VKKRALLLSAAAILVLVAVIGGTLASFSTGSEKGTATIELQDVKVALAANPKEDIKATLDIEGGLPGQERDLSVYSVSNDLDNGYDIYTKVVIDKQWEGEDLNAEYIHLFLGETELCADSVNSTVNGWIVQYADDEQIVLYYSEKLNPTQKTTDFVTKAVLDAKMDNQYADKTANITVTVSAVQAEVAEKAMPSEWGVYPTFSGTTITAIAE